MQHSEVMELVLPFKNKLYRYALRIAGNTFEAEDIVQEVLIKIWKKKEQFLSIDNKEAWCMTITRNLAIDKKRARKMKISSIDDYHHIGDRESTPSEALEMSETMKTIMSHIDALPERQKSVVHLRDVEGFTYKEISEMTSLSVDQVKVTLHRARKTLREKLRNIRK